MSLFTPKLNTTALQEAGKFYSVLIIFHVYLALEN
jgi:hypothetical protein